MKDRNYYYRYSACRVSAIKRKSSLDCTLMLSVLLHFYMIPATSQYSSKCFTSTSKYPLWWIIYSLPLRIIRHETSHVSTGKKIGQSLYTPMLPFLAYNRSVLLLLVSIHFGGLYLHFMWFFLIIAVNGESGP